MSKSLKVLVLILALTVSLSAQWHGAWRISNTSGSSYAAYSSGGWSIAADENDVYIVWRDYSYSQQIRAVEFPIGSPPAAGSGVPVSGSYGYDPGVAAGDGTNAHAVWQYSQYSYFNDFNGSSWGSPYNFGQYRWWRPAITDDDAGNSYMTSYGYWYNPSFVYRLCYRERSSAGSWGPQVNVWTPSSSSYHYFVYPSICLDPGGVRHISVGVYRSSGNRYLIAHAWSVNGTSWSHEDVTGNYSAYHVRPSSICSDPDGNLFIAYMDYPSPYQVSVVDNVGGSWNMPVQISNCPSSLYYLSICCDTSGTVWVAWEDRSGSTYEIYYATRPPGGPWGAPQELTSNDGVASRYPNLAADPHGNVHITWTDRRDGNYEVYYDWYTGGGGPGPGGRDLECMRITQPLGKIPTDPVVPKAVIRNNGGAEDSCYATCEITGPGSSYDEGNEEGIVYLDPEQQFEVEFPAWTPPGGPGDQYKVTVTVYLWPERTTEDDDPLNNSKAEYCTIEGGVQVDPIAVVMPEEGGVHDRMIPEAEFMNTGTETATDFYCYCEILGFGAYHTEDYIDSFAVASLDPEATTTATFDEWVCDDSSAYEARFFAAIPGSPDRQLIGIEEFVNFQGTPFTGVAEQDALRIEVAGANPFVEGTLISYAMPDPSVAELCIYDATGKAVRTLYAGNLYGEGYLYWNGTDDAGSRLPGGLYFLRISTPEVNRTVKLIMLN